MKAITIITVVLFFVACKKQVGPQGPSGEQGVKGTVPNGTISGKVPQFDEYGTQYSVNLNTTTVSIDGTSYSTVTDVAGSYSITNVPPGIYSISFVKPNAGFNKIQQVTFPGNGTLYVYAEIYDKATFTLNGYIKDTVISSINYDLMNLNFSASDKFRNFLVICGKTNDVDISNNLSYDYINTYLINQNSNSFQITNAIYGSYQLNSYTSGTKLFVKIYPANRSNYFGISSYYDYLSGKMIYTGCGTPIATTFTLSKP